MPSLVIEMGHCYRTTGATGTTGEQNYATRVADVAIGLLNGKNGWTVRKKLADSGNYNGSAFVAVHCDGSIHPEARGASIGYQNASGQQSGQAAMQAYFRRGWTGGFRPDNYTASLAGYYGVRNAINAGNSRAFIIECGFRTNANDLLLLDFDGGVERVVYSIGEALGIVTSQEGMISTMDEKTITDAVMQRDIPDYATANETDQIRFSEAVGRARQDAFQAFTEAKKANAELALVKAELAEIKEMIGAGFTLTPDGSITVVATPGV